MFPSFGAENRLLELPKYVSCGLVQTGVLALDQELTSFDGVDLVLASSLFHVVDTLQHVARDPNNGGVFRRGSSLTKTSLADRRVNTTAGRDFNKLRTEIPA